MTRFGDKSLFFALAASVGLLLVGSMALQAAPKPKVADDEKAAAKKADSKDDAAAKEDAAEDRYAVPDGDAEELMKFIDGIRMYRPKDLKDAREHQAKALKAMQAAAAKILEVETDKTSEAYKKASQILLVVRVQALRDASDKEQRETIEQIKNHLADSKSLGSQEVGLAQQAATALEFSGKSEAAAEAYKSFSEVIAKSDDEKIAKLAEKMAGAARRLSALGEELEIKGTTVGGDDLDWSSYRGKVVLVDFWATWCGPCLGELPNVKANYEKYHDRGFDVVGISLDEDREALEGFLEKEEIPWTTVNEESVGWESWNAKHYGIMGIPTVMLVDKEGKVVSLNARGPELGKLLAKLIGPAKDDDKTANATEKKAGTEDESDEDSDDGAEE